MGTATRINRRGREPEELSADEAVTALREYGRWQLLRDAFIRFRFADGFSHARALAFQTVLALVPFAIAVVGLSSVLHTQWLGRVTELTITRLTAGPSSDLVDQVLRRSRERAGDGGSVALWGGALFSLVNVATAMCQIERGANRIYGIERDRPFHRKYGRGLLMAVLAGLPLGLGFILLVAGREIAAAVVEAGGPGAHREALVWAVLRWPVGIVLALLSASVIFHRAPRREQPGYTWLAFGAAVYLVLWVGLTALFGLYLRLSNSIDAVYGPLSVIISLLMWAYLTAIALFLGIAFAAQLEADRAGIDEPVLPDPEDDAAGHGRARGDDS
ncbi:YihY/virulence factor BrkB family protein [Kitasatospora sp. A2-31]|uniref:YihY/virulence factor BrkB family protein n=1 Tax=Kitasatospora sp. A2-31 TaxID=2916414 RepID=UPI001EEB279F|nr:YihY/virulence factor BrkB family protein [Kitasatospora sp. A2-31]MCG6497700.1 YihY/virulence factor BrkB family protein [Kitasatospora sp. A2-31]